MSSENTPDQTGSDRVIAYLSRINDVYERAEDRTRNYTPFVVRSIEILLALALLAVLTHWLYWVYIIGA